MPSPDRAPTYRAVLRVTGVPRFLTPAMLGRLSYGMVSLALILAVVHTTGSYARLGLVMGLFGLTVAVLSPLRASLIDRHGLLRALLPMALLHALALLGLAAASWNPGAHLGTLVVLAAVAGACAPPLGPVTRSVWSHLITDRGLLQRAYSLDTVTEELIFFTGPLLLGALMWVWPPSAGLALGAVLVVSGTVGLVTSAAARSMDAARTGPGSATEPAPKPDPGAGRARGPKPTARGGFLSAVAISGAAGLTLGSAVLLNVAFAERQTAGSALGGLAYGALAWRTGTRTRLALLGLALGGGVAAAALVPGVPALVALLFVVGVFGAPLLTTAYLLADESVAPGYRTRAGNWVNTAYNAGSTVGGAGVGLFLTVAPPSAGYPLIGAVLVLVAATVLLTARRTAAPRPGTSGLRMAVLRTAAGGSAPSATRSRRRR
ncbi:MFS transporter [Nocardiopsis metallicus]|uniref:MFS family permease n=1 Tax=Nocardiopsis metallicus TaxID=179819 RepID=A0A840WIN7_9ACTN|nr:MFS transporter [Nocardiopsis metallicus]MBB5491547.1 MFS family permease [Nocardiopsis metallicus]